MKYARKVPKKELLQKLLFVAALAVFLVSASYLIYDFVIVPFQSHKSVSEFQTAYENGGKESPASQGQQSPGEGGILPKFQSLLALNEDTAGWLVIPNTSINHPVFYRPEGNNYYLKRDAKKNDNKLGSLYIGDHCAMFPAPSQVLIMYGHNMEDSDEMFGQLMKYKKLDFLKQNPVFTFDTLYEESKWKIIGVCRVSAEASHGDNFPYTIADYESPESFDSFLYNMRIRSLFYIQDGVSYSDQLMIFSTCDYAFYGDRLIVVARKLREGETEEKIRRAYHAEQNRFALYPNLYYQTYGASRPGEEDLQAGYNAFYGG